MKLKTNALLLLSVLMNACAPDMQTDQGHSALNQAGGATPDTINRGVLHTVLSARLASGAINPRGCGATLISPRILVTAAHCVALFLDESATVRDIGINESTTTSIAVPIVQRCFVHPNAYIGVTTRSCFQRFSDPRQGINAAHDLAVLVLERRLAPELGDEYPVPNVASIPPWFAAPSGASWTADSWSGQPITVVGWGRSPAGPQPRLSGAAVLGAPGFGTEGNIFNINFTNPMNWYTSGDSGGAVLALVGGVQRLIAVNSTTNDITHSPNHATPLGESSNRDFILNIADPRRTGDYEHLYGSSDSPTSGCVLGANPEDADCDGFTVHGNGRDNCPSIPNLNQQDRDGDLVGDPCDNCQINFNPNQENCNLEAEAVFGPEREGDACDARACPDIARRMGVSTTTQLTLSISQGTEPLYTNPPLRASVAFRFCRCDSADRTMASRLACALGADSGGSECVQRSGSQGSTAVFMVAEPPVGVAGWHRVQMTDIGNCPTCSPDAPGQLYPMQGSTVPVNPALAAPTERTMRWSASLDAPTFGLLGGGSYFAINGVMWTHVPQIDYESCYPSCAPEADTAGDNRVSSRTHYISGQFVEGTNLLTTLSDPIIRYLGYPALPDFVCLQCVDDDALSQPALLVLPGAQIHARLDGGDVDLNNHVGSVARQALLDSSLRWLSRGESPSVVEAGSPLLIGVASNGIGVRAAISAVGSELRDTREINPPTTINIGNAEPRYYFGAVQSGAPTTRGAYILGGVDAWGQTPAALEHFDVLAGSWASIPLIGTERPEYVLSSAIRHTDQSLFTLDYTASDVATVRLVRVGATSGITTVVQTWPDPYYDNWSVAVAWDGRIVVTRTPYWVTSWKAELAEVTDSGYTTIGTLSGSGQIQGDVGATGRGISVLIFDGQQYRTIGFHYAEFNGGYGYRALASPSDEHELPPRGSPRPRRPTIARRARH